MCIAFGKVHKAEKLPDKTLFDQDKFYVQADIFS